MNISFNFIKGLNKEVRRYVTEIDLFICKYVHFIQLKAKFFRLMV